MTNSEKVYITNIDNKIKNNEPTPHYPVNIVKGKSIQDLFQAAYIYRSVLR